MTGSTQLMADVAIYVAVTDSAATLGPMRGTVTHFFWPKGSRFVVRGFDGALGLALACGDAQLRM